jgi:LuxR family maltose regulon positive regulatory protein
MPRRIPYRLQWSSSTQEYVVFYDGRPVTPRIEPVSQHWFAWLETISSFSFQSRSGAGCTVRKESVQRGGTYWYAYRRKGQRMVKGYGKDCFLGQPYEPFNPLKLFLHPAYTITYEKSFI